jgi:hypothetical protein
MDYHKEAKEAYQEAKEYVREQYDRIREDFDFSNPASPKQWSDQAQTARAGRPTHTLDRTNKYVQHVVNRLRESKSGAQILPVDSRSDVAVAAKITGMFRHIEYVSRADIAWDTATDHMARGGLGWVRVVPKMVDKAMNEQEIVIQRVHDPLSCLLESGWTEPDGTDAKCGFVESWMTKKAFKSRFPKAEPKNWESDNVWIMDDGVLVCEYFRIVESEVNRIVIPGPDGGEMSVGEDEFHTLSAQTGVQAPVIRTYKATERAVRWCMMNGNDILEETTYPSQYIGLVPMIGNELWVEGKRYLCGLVRKLMDGQRLHNMEMSALTEALMIQPKAPFLVSNRALADNEEDWAKLNSGSPAYLPYNDMDEMNQPIASPQRLSPPNFPVAYANMAQLAVQEMEESVGMPRSTFGQQGNAVSGRAKLADQEAGSAATYHFADNRRICQEQVYRIVLDMLPTIYDSRRQARVLGEDGEQSSVEINPNLETASALQGGKIVSINPGVGKYDVRVKIGPSYSTIREEMGVKLQELGKGNPVLAAALTPILMKLSDMPEADKISRVAIAMLPPEVQAAYHEEDSADMPPAAKAQITQQGQQIQQMASAMEQASSVIQDLQQQVNEKSTQAQDQVKIAMGEIKAAKAGLDAQAAEVDSKSKLFAQDVRIAQLELELQATKQAEADSQQFNAGAESQSVKLQQEIEMTLEQIAQAMAESQAKLAQAIEANTQVVARLQSLTVDAMGEIADAMMAPRDIQLRRDAQGKATGAVSVPVQAPETMQ